MNKIIVIICLPMFLVILFVSCKSHSISKDASFPGGNQKLDLYLKENLDWRQNQLTIQGKVYVKFFVNEKGEINNVSIVRGLCSSCDLESIRVIESMPNWIPAKREGKNVISEVVIPINFNIRLDN